MQVFCDQASLLAGNGVTITVSSGDNGVAGNSCLCGGTSAGYRPSFPATCPYVTAVGATMGPNQGDPEYACQSNTGGIITTGGGFSTYFLAQEWQKESITLYFNRLTAAQKPTTGYSTIGRGIPDISLMGVNYPTIIGGKTAYMYGTSASSPVFAGFITLANSIRQSSGLGTLGFLNPTLYQFGDNSTTGLPTLQNATFNDITSGYNKCCALQNYQINPTCCQAGFYAIEGWDPVTGWGSVNFPSFAIMASVVAPYYPASNNGGGSNNGAVAGIVVGVILAICCVGCIVAGVFYFFCRPKQDALLTQSYVTSSTPVQNTVPQAIVMGKVVTSDNRA